MVHDKAVRVAVVATTKVIDAARRTIAAQQVAAGMVNVGTMTDDEVAQWCVLDVAQKQFATEGAAIPGFITRTRNASPSAYPRVKK